MKPMLRVNWTSIDSIPVVSTPAVQSPAGRGRNRSRRSAASSADSEEDKHRQCSEVLRQLSHGATIAEAAQGNHLSEDQVTRILHSYGIRYIVSNGKHQVDDGVHVGPWTDSRYFQSGCQRYKNDFHSWRYCWAMGLSVDEALDALKNWPELKGIKTRLIEDYPLTWERFARVDIARCYPKFAQYTGPALVSKQTLAKVKNIIAGLNKATFKAKELVGKDCVKIRQIQRALSLLPNVRKLGAKRGARWEILTATQTENSLQFPRGIA